MPSVGDFFLGSEDVGDDWKFLAPARPNVTIEPLIDGIDTFASIERAVASAAKTVNFAAWIFNAQLPLQAKAQVNKILARRGVRKKASCWGELFALVAGLGVEVRISLADFDGVLQNDLHEVNWRNYQRMRAYAARYANKHLQIMVVMHDAKVSFVANLALKAEVSARWTRVLANLNRKGFASAINRLMDMPRIWPLVMVDKAAGKLLSVAAPPFDIRPAAHHQKICILDSKIGFCGGLDPQTGRIDSKLHKRGWHDTECRVDGPLAADLDRNFVGRWNREMKDFNAFIAGAKLGTRKLPSNPVTAMIIPPAASTSGAGPATGQLIRTLSENALVGSVPTNVRDDIKEAYRNAIGLAQQFVYIENQYVRSNDLGGWLIARANAVPTLQVIVVLPVAPEEVASGADPVTMLGLSLQHGVLKKLKSALGPRFGMYSMIKPETVPRSRAHATDFANSRQVYVHSKAMIIDDVWATIGSANTSPRSFEVDTEANIHWHDPDSVKNLRLTLWKELLGSPAGLASWAPSDFVANWDVIAKGNMPPKAPRMRQGFVVPHDPDKFPGKPNSSIPDAFAELGDIPAENDRLADEAVA